MFFLQVFRIRHLKSHTIYPDRFSLLYFSHKEFPDKKAPAPLEQQQKMAIITKPQHSRLTSILVYLLDFTVALRVFKII